MSPLGKVHYLLPSCSGYSEAMSCRWWTEQKAIVKHNLWFLLCNAEQMILPVRTMAKTISLEGTAPEKRHGNLFQYTPQENPGSNVTEKNK